jgi:hypothetical protein
MSIERRQDVQILVVDITVWTFQRRLREHGLAARSKRPGGST